MGSEKEMHERRGVRLQYMKNRNLCEALGVYNYQWSWRGISKVGTVDKL